MTDQTPLSPSPSPLRHWLLVLSLAAGLTIITYAVLFQHFNLLGGD